MKELIILGAGPTREECDYRSEVWSCNFCYYFAKRIDKLFFTDDAIEIEAWPYRMLYRLRELHPTFVFPRLYPKFRDFGLPVEIYPIEEIKGRFHTDYFSSSIAYMLALAIYKGYEEIRLYGIEYPNHGYEEIQERSGTEFWIGIARGLGIKVYIPPGADLCRTWNRRMYGEFGAEKKDVHFGSVTYRAVRRLVTKAKYKDWKVIEPGNVIDMPSCKHLEVVVDRKGRRAAIIRKHS